MTKIYLKNTPATQTEPQELKPPEYSEIRLYGYLAADPEYLHDKSGKYYMTFPLAVTRPQPDNLLPSQVDFFRIEAEDIKAIKKTEDDFGIRIRKGSHVSILGHLENHVYENSEGIKRYITKIMAKEIHILILDR